MSSSSDHKEAFQVSDSLNIISTSSTRPTTSWYSALRRTQRKIYSELVSNQMLQDQQQVGSGAVSLSARRTRAHSAARSVGKQGQELVTVKQEQSQSSSKKACCTCCCHCTENATERVSLSTPQQLVASTTASSSCTTENTIKRESQSLQKALQNLTRTRTAVEKSLPLMLLANQHSLLKLTTENNTSTLITEQNSRENNGQPNSNATVLPPYFLRNSKRGILISDLANNFQLMQSRLV